MYALNRRIMRQIAYGWGCREWFSILRRVNLDPVAMSSNKFLIEFTKIYLRSIFHTIVISLFLGVKFPAEIKWREFWKERRNKTDLLRKKSAGNA